MGPNLLVLLSLQSLGVATLKTAAREAITGACRSVVGGLGAKMAVTATEAIGVLKVKKALNGTRSMRSLRASLVGQQLPTQTALGNVSKDCFSSKPSAPVRGAINFGSSKPQAGRSTFYECFDRNDIKDSERSRWPGVCSGGKGIASNAVIRSKRQPPTLTYHDEAQPTCITFIAVFRGSDTKDCDTRGRLRSLPQHRG
jgi:hypothetical protein